MATSFLQAFMLESLHPWIRIHRKTNLYCRERQKKGTIRVYIINHKNISYINIITTGGNALLVMKGQYVITIYHLSFIIIITERIFLLIKTNFSCKQIRRFERYECFMTIPILLRGQSCIKLRPPDISTSYFSTQYGSRAWRKKSMKNWIKSFNKHRLVLDTAIRRMPSILPNKGY